MTDLHVRTYRGGYAIFDANGARVSGERRAKSDAERGIDHELQRRERQTRNCMCCGRQFSSQSRFIRLCHECRSQTHLADFAAPDGL